MTPRELSIVLDGARWRIQQRGRDAIADAWQLANFMKAKKLPNLKVVLKRFDRACEARPQEPGEVWANLKDFAARNNLRVTRHERSVLHG